MVCPLLIQARMPSLSLFFTLALLATAHSAPALAEDSLCGIRLEGAAPDFSGSEKDWLCGTEESRAWSRIPPAQKIYFLRRFFQERGYHQPRFRVEGDLLVVEAGEKQIAKSFRVEGAPPELNWKKRRRLLGRTLTPALLDESRNWVDRELQQMGYPCPDSSVIAVHDRGLLEVRVDAGKRHAFGLVESEGGPDLPHQIVERYTAFVPGQDFDIRLLELSARRILAHDLYLSTYYELACDSPGDFRIIRRFVPAPPRLVTAGAGFDTERGPLFRARYRRVRIGRKSHAWETTVLASFREQSISSRFDWYFTSKLESPLRLAPEIAIERKDEEKFESTTYRATPLFANEWEMPRFRLGAEIGPSFEHTVTQRGPGERIVDLGQLLLRLHATSHLFEYYATRPRSGWTASLDASTRAKGALSTETVQRILLRHEILWNLGRLDPPFLVFGWRGSIGTFIFPEHSRALNSVPASERFFLGGDSDIRGFGRKELPGSETGFLTALYQGIELRAGEWWAVPLQPLLFFDLAKGGREPASLSPSLYLAPGVGLRYESFIGSMRATLGRGIVKNPAQGDPEGGLQFFFSLGREF